MGGEPVVRALVERFYDLMELDPGYERLRAVHGSSLESAREKLFMFLSGWSGGPQLYLKKFGHPRLRARHMPFAIGIVERDEWLWCMNKALDESGFDPDLVDGLRKHFAETADFMRNQAEG